MFQKFFFLDAIIKLWFDFKLWNSVIPTTTAKPTLQGDPHVRVSQPDEPAICFDITDDDASILSIIADLDSGLEVNGQVFAHGDKKDKVRLERVGILSPRGVEVGIYIDQVTIGMGGQVKNILQVP